MIKHIIKLVWNRKRANALVALEIAISFLVLFGVVSLGAYCWLNYRRPLGYSYENVWNVRIGQDDVASQEWSPERIETNRQILLAVQNMPEVESVAGVFSPPYSFSTSISGRTLNGRELEFHNNSVTDDYLKVMHLTLTRGRWFSREDDARHDRAVVINEKLARMLCGSDDPIGKVLTKPEEPVQDRVIGVITDFRKDGEYVASVGYAFTRARLDDPDTRMPDNLAVRVKPGTRRDFEERLTKGLQAVAPSYSFVVRPLSEMRETVLRLRRGPLIVSSLVAFFLLMMVGLGLTGVLWQNVTQRTKEIGLRRAKGATVMHIYTQILGENLVITSLGVCLGFLVAVQFPLLALLGQVSTEVYILSFAVSVVLIYSLTMLCALYPSRLASSVRPAEALHYE